MNSTINTMPEIVFPAKANDAEKQELQDLAARYWAIRGDQESVKTLAEDVGKSYRSLIMTLVRAGVYQKVGYRSKTGDKVLKKEEIIDTLAGVIDFTDAEAASLAAANKAALIKIAAALKA